MSRGQTVGGTDLPEASVALGRLKAVVDGALVAVAERLEETRSAEAIGWASTKDFLTHVTGGRKGTGASLVRVAKHTADLPEVRAALTAGSISLAQAGVIGGRVTTLPHDPEYRERTASALLDLVDNKAYDATDLDRCFPHSPRTSTPTACCWRPTCPRTSKNAAPTAPATSP